jgi:hypothetical protein
MVQNKVHQNKLSETPSAQKTHKTPINALSIAAPLGVNALKSGKISRERQYPLDVFLQFSKAHLTTLNLNNFKMIEDMGLNITATRSP